MSGTAQVLNAGSVLENLTRTLLYEGYCLYPYSRSAAKNQKPVPFGVVFPEDFHAFNVHAHAKMQSECIVTGQDDFAVNVTVRFLHLIRNRLFQKEIGIEGVQGFVPVIDMHVNGTHFQAGWQTIERTFSTGNMLISQLNENIYEIPVEYDEEYSHDDIYDDTQLVAGKQARLVSQVSGIIKVGATPLTGWPRAFRITVTVSNASAVENAVSASRDDVLPRSFLSTHIILEATGAQFISHQNPGEKWKPLIDACENISTWPILLDAAGSTILSSPIILYDYPQINPQSHGDLFDSTEIEEALLLHVALLPDEEKQRISQGDEKLRAMLAKVGQLTPGDMISFHSNLIDIEPENHNLKTSEG
jgi:hypothetical protein